MSYAHSVLAKPPPLKSIQVSAPRTEPTTIPSTRPATPIFRRSAHLVNSALEHVHRAEQTAGSNIPPDWATTAQGPALRKRQPRSIYRSDSREQPRHPHRSPHPQRPRTSRPPPPAAATRCAETADPIAKKQKEVPAKYTDSQSSKRRQQTPKDTTAYGSRLFLNR